MSNYYDCSSYINYETNFLTLYTKKDFNIKPKSLYFKTNKTLLTMPTFLPFAPPELTWFDISITSDELPNLFKIVFTILFVGKLDLLRFILKNRYS